MCVRIVAGGQRPMWTDAVVDGEEKKKQTKKRKGSEKSRRARWGDESLTPRRDEADKVDA